MSIALEQRVAMIEKEISIYVSRCGDGWDRHDGAITIMLNNMKDMQEQIATLTSCLESAIGRGNKPSE